MIVAADGGPDFAEACMGLDEREAGRTATRVELRERLPRASKAFFEGALSNPRLAVMDLHAMTLSCTVDSQVRRLSELRLAEALEVAPVGRRVAIARRASCSTLRLLLDDPHVLVKIALLSNPRLVERDVVHLATSPSSRADAIEAIANHPHWRERCDVKRAVLSNPRTSIRVALGVVQGMDREELELIPEETPMPAVARVAIERRLTESRSSGAR